MEINRFNYEEFFILYIDHELNAEERAEVETFVSAHPDLAAELEMLKDVVLKPEKNIFFSGKEDLLKKADQQPVLNKDNYQDFFILYADDELTPEEKTQVEAFVYHHPELQSELEAFEQVRLVPEKIVFPFKEKLYRRERTPVIAVWMRFAVAAMLLLIAGYVWINRPVDNTIPVVAGLNDKKPQSSAATPGHQLSSPTPANQEPVNINEGVAEKTYTTKKHATPSIKKAKSFEEPVITESNENKRLRPMRQPQVEKIEPEISLVNVPNPDNVYNRTVINAQPQAQTIKVVDASYTEPESALNEENASSDYVAGISVDNPTIKPLLRKASRIINRVAALKSGETRVIISKKVEIAIQ